MRKLVEQTESHIVIFLLLFNLLFLLGWGITCSRCLGSSSATGSRGSSYAASDVGDQVLQVNRLESLGEESGPVRLEFDISCLEDGGQLLGGDGDIVISEDEGSVGASEFRGRHFSASFCRLSSE